MGGVWSGIRTGQRAMLEVVHILNFQCNVIFVPLKRKLPNPFRKF